jgi:hypothetical protein
MGAMRRRLCAAVVLTLGLVAGACSGGGGDDDADLSLSQTETVLQFDAADKVLWAARWPCPTTGTALWGPS